MLFIDLTGILDRNPKAVFNTPLNGEAIYPLIYQRLLAVTGIHTGSGGHAKTVGCRKTVTSV